MRIISGKFRSRKLIKFKKEGIKPTTDKMRESIFNIVLPSELKNFRIKSKA